VLEEGVLEGRKVFVNISSISEMGASSNFGNMFASSRQRLGFRMSDGPIQVLQQPALRLFAGADPTDNVGPQMIAKPRPWTSAKITKFIVFIGPISSIFRLTPPTP